MTSMYSWSIFGDILSRTGLGSQVAYNVSFPVFIGEKRSVPSVKTQSVNYSCYMTLRGSKGRLGLCLNVMPH